MSARAPRLNWFAAMLEGGSPLVSMALRFGGEAVRSPTAIGAPDRRYASKLTRSLTSPMGRALCVHDAVFTDRRVYRLTDDPSRSTVHYRTGFVSSVRAGPAVACRPGIVGDEQPRSVGLRLSNELGGERA